MSKSNKGLSCPGHFSKSINSKHHDSALFIFSLLLTVTEVPYVQ